MEPLDSRYERLMVNMKNVSFASPGQKYIVIDDQYLIPDCRHIQFLIRYLSGDTRQDLLGFLRRMITQALDLLKSHDLSDDKRVKLMQILPGFRAGLEKLKITYASDHVTMFTLENYTDLVDTAIREISRLLKGRGSTGNAKPREAL